MRWLVLACVGWIGGCDRLFQVPAWQRADAPAPRPDLPLDVCGVIGTSCCSDTTCTDGSTCLALSGHTRCVGFAGVFETNPLPACGASPCLNDDRFSGSCDCPSGFTSHPFQIDEGCGNPLLAENQSTSASVCSIETLPAGSDWGGMFVVADIASCVPQAASGCVLPNPITHDCTCPPGVEVFHGRVFVTGTVGPSCANGALGAALDVCLPGGVAQSSIIGVFQRDADNTCRAYSSELTGCACPPGALVDELRSIEEQQGVMTFVPVETTITFCMLAP